eukprot:TRINITY_DN16585_c2_g2_i2.p1 TRINITY_DN16585_c2_g2~~TRINITY_DN16585_c2_g2_i2.p1  ORF type:complete len:802 (+),score=111.97 TRINITY_DN16585_c2_g2_i2:113-2518(+)
MNAISMLLLIALVLSVKGMTPVVLCGDGNVDVASEGCDDGGVMSGDGCSSSCVIEPGWSCDVSTGISLCTPRCGDSRVIGSERCDDGNTIPNDGCSPLCTWEDATWCDIRYLPTLCFKLSYVKGVIIPHSLSPFNITIEGLAVYSNRDVILKPPHPKWEIRLATTSLCIDDAAGTNPQFLGENDMTMVWYPLHQEQEVVLCILIDNGSGSGVFTPLSGVFTIVSEPYSVEYSGVHMAGQQLKLRLKSATLQGLPSTSDLRAKLSLRQDCTGDSLGTSPSLVAPDLTIIFTPRFDGHVVWVCLSENAGITYTAVNNYVTVYPEITFDGRVVSASVNSEMKAELIIENKGVNFARNLRLTILVTDVLASPMQLTCLQGSPASSIVEQCVYSCSFASTESARCNITIPMLTRATVTIKSTIIDLAEDESQDLSLTSHLSIVGANTELTVNTSTPLTRPNLVSTITTSTEDLPDCGGGLILGLFQGFSTSQQQCEQTLGCFWDDPGYYTARCSPAFRRLIASLLVRNYEPDSVANYVSTVVSVTVIGGSNRNGNLIKFDSAAADGDTKSHCTVSTSVSRVVCVLPEIRDVPIQLKIPFWVSASFTGEVLCTTFVESSVAWGSSEPVSSTVAFTGILSESPTLNTDSRNDTFGELEELSSPDSAADLWWMYVLIGLCIIIFIALVVYFVRRFFCVKSIELIVVPPSGQEEVVEIPTTKTIYDLKVHLERVFGIPAKRQLLESCPGEVLCDNDTIKEISSVVHRSMISLLVITPTESVVDSNPLDELFPASGQAYSPAVASDAGSAQ